MTPVAMPPLTWSEAYRMRWKRRRLLWRAIRARRALLPVADRTDALRDDEILLVSVVRNEAKRLPYFLDYYRRLGVGHFLVVDNGSDDGTVPLLVDCPDVSLWQTGAAYRDARFGLDWMTWLQIMHAHDRWCLMVDADEILTYDGIEQHELHDLTELLDGLGQEAFGAIMVDLYPSGPVNEPDYEAGQDPLTVLNHFDASPHRAKRQRPMGNLWVQGGARDRFFFADDPQKAPTLNKIPLVRWNRRYVYANSTHSALPPRLNAVYDGPGDARPSGALLHTKFLPEIVSKAEIEQRRGQHFHTPSAFQSYYEALRKGPDLWYEDSQKYNGPPDLIAAGLMPAIHWV